MLKFYHTEVGNWLTDLTLKCLPKGSNSSSSQQRCQENMVLEDQKLSNKQKKSENFPFPGDGVGIFPPIPPAKHN